MSLNMPKNPMPFGVHKDKDMDDVPASYLAWLRDQDWLEEKWPTVAEYIRTHKKSIDKDLELEEELQGD